MSQVPASQRTEAASLYVDLAHKACFTIEGFAPNLPKRWREARTRYTLDAANRLEEDCRRANAIWVTNDVESEMRLRYLTEAYVGCHVLQGKLDDIHRLQPKRERRKTIDGETIVERDVPCVSDGVLEGVAIDLDRVAGILHRLIEKERARLAELRVGGGCVNG